MDARTVAGDAAPRDRAGLLHGRRVLCGAGVARRRLRSPRSCVLLAHFGGSILWVFSTVLLQIEVPDRFADAYSPPSSRSSRSHVASRATSQATRSIALAWSPRSAVASRSARSSACPGTLWLLILSRWHENRDREPLAATAPSDRRRGVCACRHLARGFELLHRALHQLLGIVELLEHQRDVHLAAGRETARCGNRRRAGRRARANRSAGRARRPGVRAPAPSSSRAARACRDVCRKTDIIGLTSWAVSTAAARRGSAGCARMAQQIDDDFGDFLGRDFPVGAFRRRRRC